MYSSLRFRQGRESIVVRLSATPLITIPVMVIVCLVMCSAGCKGTQESANHLEKTTTDIHITHHRPEESLLSGSSIAFTREDRIWISRGDGDEQRQLTEGFDCDPAVSPDGRTVVYVHYEKDPERMSRCLGERPSSSGIYAIPSDGGEPRLLTPASWFTTTGWTPLWGEKRYDPDDPLGPPLGLPRWILRDCIEPSFSPDGKTICFLVRDTYEQVANPTSYCACATMNSEGSGEPRLLFTVRNDEGWGPVIESPRFSPDGSEIYVNCTAGPNSGEPGEGGIYKVSSRGGELVSVTNGYRLADVCDSLEVIAAFPSCSEGCHSRGKIVLLGMDGGWIRDVYASPTHPSPVMPELSLLEESLSFTPSGEIIAFGGPTAVYAIPSDGGEPARIISDGCQPCFGRHQ